MNTKYKYFPAAILIFSFVFIFCSDKKKELRGSWESIKIENKSSLFRKTLPSCIKGEVILTLTEDEKFTWINKTEKLNLSGKYRFEKNKLYFDIDKEENPLAVEFRFQKDKLTITTEDEFTYTFIKKE